MNTKTAMWVAQYTVTLFELVLILRCDDFSLVLFLFCKCLNSGFEILYLILLYLIWFNFGLACFTTIGCGEFWFGNIFLTRIWDGGWWWRFGNSQGASFGFLQHIQALAGNIDSFITDIDISSKQNYTQLSTHIQKHERKKHWFENFET